jgi:Holliday junction resolvase RusA-like endonuclease
MSDAFAHAIDAWRAGYDEGLCPFMGEWHRRFDFPPIPYSAGGKARSSFRLAVQESLGNRFLFSNLIEVVITLQLETQKVMESDAYGDLDNYSKSINDVLKGRNGLFVDDCQIYRLDVGFELMSRAAFDVQIKAMLPDEFVLKEGLKLYEMPDGLFYPQAEALWEEGKVKRLRSCDVWAGLIIWEAMTRNKKALRHARRTAGATRIEAFHFARPAMPLQLGFHRTRAMAGGIDLVDHESWRAECDAFLSSGDDGGRIAEVQRSMNDYVSKMAEIFNRQA